MAKETGLGKGVGLLFGDDEDTQDNGNYFLCDIDNITPNKYQPRTHFNDDELEDLSRSIAENGIIQPLIVKRTDDENRYELIAGERRLRASKLVGLSQVPVVINEVEDDNILLELALVENIQRTDLNAVEEAEAYQKLIEKFGYTQEQTAKRVGKKRSTVTNALRLLKLPQHIREDVVTGTLSEGHARSLLRLVDDELLLDGARAKIIEGHLSVRQTEQLVKKLLSQQNVTESTPAVQQLVDSKVCEEVTDDLGIKFDTKVSISQKGSKGMISIEFGSKKEFERILELMNKL